LLIQSGTVSVKVTDDNLREQKSAFILRFHLEKEYIMIQQMQMEFVLLAKFYKVNMSITFLQKTIIKSINQVGFFKLLLEKIKL